LNLFLIIFTCFRRILRAESGQLDFFLDPEDVSSERFFSSELVGGEHQLISSRETT